MNINHFSWGFPFFDPIFIRSWAFQLLRLLRSAPDVAQPWWHFQPEKSRKVVQPGPDIHQISIRYPQIMKHSYWKWPFIVALPTKTGDFLQLREFTRRYPPDPSESMASFSESIHFIHAKDDWPLRSVVDSGQFSWRKCHQIWLGISIIHWLVVEKYIWKSLGFIIPSSVMSENWLKPAAETMTLQLHVVTRPLVSLHQFPWLHPAITGPADWKTIHSEPGSIVP